MSLARGPSIDMSTSHKDIPPSHQEAFLRDSKAYVLARAPPIGITHEGLEWADKVVICYGATFGHIFD